MKAIHTDKCSRIRWEYVLLVVGFVGFISMWAPKASFAEDTHHISVEKPSENLLSKLWFHFSGKADSILILYFHRGEVEVTKPRSLIISPSRPRSSIATINYDPTTEVFQSCSIVHQNSLYIFGGSNNVTQNQISKLDGCRIRRIGSLGFPFQAGTCAIANQQIFLCFHIDEGKKCHVGLEPLGSFDRIKNSVFTHSMSRIAAANGKALTVRVEI